MKQANRILRILSNLISGVLLALVVIMVGSLILTKVSGGPPAILGHQVLIVSSGSMEPTVHTGSLVFVKPTDPAEILVGDIITYQGQGEAKAWISHRVAARQNGTEGIEFITKGDANDVADPMPVAAKKVLGKINLAIPYLGYFFNLSQSVAGRRILILIAATGLLMVGINSLFSLFKAAKDKKTMRDSSK